MDVEDAKFLSRRIVSHAPFVGLIAMHFNETERRFHEMVAVALRLSPRAGAALAAQAGPALADMLKVAARHDGRTELAFALPYAARLFEACRMNRNLIVHGIFSNPEFGPQDVIVMQKTTARGGVKAGAWAVAVEDLEQVIVEILGVGTFLAMLTARIVGDDAGPWPDAPPMPRRRSDTLVPFHG